MRVMQNFVLTLTVLCLLAGCGSSPFTKRFGMQALEFQPGQQVEGGPLVAIEPVAMGDAINQQKIIAIGAGSVADVQEYKRWLDDPANEVARVVAANISSLVPTERVVTLPWRPTRDFDYTLKMNVVEFGPQTDGAVRVTLFWALTDGDDVVRTFRRSSYSQTPAGTDIDDAIPVFSILLGQLSRDIAQEIRALAQQDRIALGSKS